MDEDGCLVSFSTRFIVSIWYASFQHMRPKGFLMNTRSIRYMWKLIISECVHFSVFFFYLVHLPIFHAKRRRARVCVFCSSCSPPNIKASVENEIHTHTHIIEATDAWAKMFWLKSAIKKQCFTTSQINDNHTGKKTNSTVPSAIWTGEAKRCP